MINRFPFLLLILWMLAAFDSYSQNSPLLNSFGQFQKAKNNSSIHLEWIPLGPVINSARVEAVQLDPTRPGTMYVAFGSGNLWKTANHGLSWKPIFEQQPALGIGDIALAPSDPDILYLGSGESLRKRRNFTLPGTGIYRSNDGGNSWKHLGLANSWHIGEIAVHPADPDIVFVAVMGKFWSADSTKGIYRTLNGGVSWQRVLYVDENTRANDVVIAPADPNIIYASMWQNNSDPELAESVYGPNSSIYRSEDGGNQWKEIANGLPPGPKKGRIGLAVSYTDPDKVYALMDNLNKNRIYATEVYRTVDGGKKWIRTHADEQAFSSVIGWYFADIYVNPRNDEEIFALGVRLAHSQDGGRSFDLIGGEVQHIQPSAAQTLHLDHCELWINPANPNQLALGNDGGFYVSYDKGSSWMHYNNIPTGEFYDLAVEQRTPYRIFAGTQDNATVYGPGKEWNDQLTDPWRYLWIDAWSGGDGCITQIDPENPHTIYFSLQNGGLYRKDLKADTSKYIKPKVSTEQAPDLRYNFVTPYAISPHDPATLYQAGNYVLKTENRGEDWELISPDLSSSRSPAKQSVAAGAIAVSKIQPGLLYIGMDRGALWVSSDDGRSWAEYSSGLADNYIRSISPSRFKASRVYLAMTGLNYDDLGAYLYASEDYGKNWTPLNSNLPDEPVNVILEDSHFENILYAGTLRGVFVSLDRGQSWQVMGSSLPMAPVADLEIHEYSRDLILATHGRGIFKVNLQPLHDLYELGLTLEQAYLFDLMQVSAPKKRDTHKDIDIASLEKLPISFWLTSEELVTLALLEGDDLLWSTNVNAKPGLNQFRWDLITKHHQSNLPYFYHYQQYIEPGRYKLILETKSGTLERELQILSARAGKK